MGTIQVRLSSQDQLKKRLAECVGKNINIVFSDHTVSFGTLDNFFDDRITVRNMRLKKKTFLLADISEVFFDKTTLC